MGGTGSGRPRKRAAVESGSDSEEEEASLFPVGTEVEVRSDDLGFIGSFYEATVEGHLTGGAGYVVAYATLVGDEHGALLREDALAADVRPRPPPPPPPDARAEGFTVHEMVEAFHNDGWWSGVVSALQLAPADGGDGRLMYTVTFPTSREVLEFEEAELRPHRVFRRGKWVPAADAHMDNGSDLFGEGSLVEVSRSAKSFGESWNPATVLKVIGSTNFLVQYGHSGKDGDLVTEIVDYQYIRPERNTSSMDSKHRFSPSSHVEVFHDGSWWPAVILEASGSGSCKKYVVKLKSDETDMDDVECVDMLTVGNGQLRPRFDWDGRKWIRCFKEKPVMKEPLLSYRRRPISAPLASCDDSDEIRENLSSYLDKKSNNADVVPRPISPLRLVCDDTDEINHQSRSYPGGSMKQQNAILALKSPDTSKKIIHFKKAQVALPLQSSIKHPSSSSLGFGHLESSSRTDAMPSMPQSGQMQASLFGAFGQLRPLPQGPVLGRQSPNRDFSITEGSNKSLTGQRTKRKRRENTAGACHSLVENAEKRKEYVPSPMPEELGAYPENSKKKIAFQTIEETNNCAVSSIEHTKPNNEDDKLPSDVIAGSGILSEENTVRSIDTTAIKDNRGSQESNATFSAQHNVFTHSSTTFGPNEQDGVPQQDHDLAMVEFATESSQPIENSAAVTQLSSVSLDAELANSLIAPKDIDGTLMTKYVTRIDDFLCHSPQKSLDVHESIMADCPSESLSTMNYPIMKTSQLWAQFEAMEIFSKFPQRPNFCQCQHDVPEIREGMALGMMSSFANLVESIKRLNINDCKAVFEEKMKGLSLLEENGFDVRYLQSFLKDLLRIKDIHTKTQEVRKQLQEKIAQKEIDDQQLCRQSGILSMVVRQLELNLSVFRNIEKSAISQKMDNAMEISRLETEDVELQRSCLSIKQQFSSVAAALW